MKKSDLKNGMIVVTRDAKIGIILNDIIYGIDWWNPLSHYDDNLQSPRWNFEGEPEGCRGGKTDIVKVYLLAYQIGTYLTDLLTKENLEKYGSLCWEEFKAKESESYEKL